MNAAASPTEVRLGSTFTVFITATYGAGVEVNLREPVELGSAFEVRRKLSQDLPTSDGRTKREWQLEVIAWELGDLAIPPISVTFTAFGRVGEVATNRARVKVTGLLGDMVDDPKAIRDHAPPTELLRRDWFWLWIAGGGAALLIAASVAILLVRRPRRRAVELVAGAVAAPRRLDLASARALEQLLAIERSGVLDRDGDRKAGYTEMAEVIREYLGARYRVALTDLTTSELMRKLDPRAPADERALIEQWLERCDIVKYGGHRATVAEAHQTLDDARALIVTTTSSASGAKAPGPSARGTGTPASTHPPAPRPGVAA